MYIYIYVPIRSAKICQESSLLCSQRSHGSAVPVELKPRSEHGGAIGSWRPVPSVEDFYESIGFHIGFQWIPMDSILDSILDTQGIFMMDYELRLIGLKFATHSRGFPPKKGPVNFVGWLLIETPVF